MSLPLDLPLRGSQLIEASAGTGKTFTIALLYVRLVLGHGQPEVGESPRDNGYLRPLVPPEILVVTFTEAASMELKERIRDRLVQAAAAFREAPEDADRHSADPLLALRNEYPADLWAACARRLQVAAEWMDDAAVSTIHGWSQKMLKEHAFDSGNLFHQELVPDLTDLVQEAINDYWRSLVYPLEEHLARAAITVFGGPAGLERRLRDPLRRPDAALTFQGEPLDTGRLQALLAEVARALQDQREGLARARASYCDDPAAVREALIGVRPGMNARTFSESKSDEAFEAALAQLDDICRLGVEPPRPGGSPKSFIEKLARSSFAVKKGHAVPDHPLLDHLEQWRQGHEAIRTVASRLEPLMLADACTWVRTRLERQLRERAQMGYDDMIRGLDRALAGDNGPALAQRIREQYPVAMIDEFQDTDPAQYRIFDRIYPVAENAPETGLILIGDPKQAIYGFRGGDIHTYLRARRATEGRHHTLDTNFRSSAAMVEGVNRLFGHAEGHERGAFRFVEGDDNPLPFQPVAAKGRKETLVLDGQPVSAAVTAWMPEDGEALGNEAYLRLMAEHGASRIAEWLTQARHGRAGIREDGEPDRPLEAGDIAILVRDRKEAAAIRQALSRRNLPSVYLSDRDSVFASREAGDVLAWLRACAEPDNDERVRAALATATLALPLAELDALQRDELAWERQQERFALYRRQWYRQGVLPTLRQLLHDFAVPQRCLAEEQGERRITNLLHLAEWAQQASDTLDGDHALIRLLAEHIDDPGGEEQILRLESDAHLIQVVTIFKSKGLEYPVVLLPFICTAKEVNHHRASALYHRDHQPVLELAPHREARAQYELADDERLSEEMRLLYVAITRARYATFMGLAPLKIGTRKACLEKSAVGYLLAGGRPVDSGESLASAWQARCEASPALGTEWVPDAVSGERYVPADDAVARQPARTPTHPGFSPWWVASYSALQQHAADAPESPQAATRIEERLAETGAEGLAVSRAAPVPGTLHAFPRGPEPGTFLHGVLESLAEQGFAGADRDTDRVRRLTRRCEYRGWGEHAPALADWMAALPTTPLAPAGEDGPVLAELAHYWAEADFWFATRQARTPAIDRLVQAHFAPGKARPALGYHQLDGLMKGFIDLVAEHEGRFYVLDWKSNWLGAGDDDYRPDVMEQAMLDKRYDVQMAIYLLALHRHLRDTLPGYDYERDVGGAMLVFLRGLSAESRGIHRVKPSLAFITALDALMAGEAHADQEAS